MGAHSWTPAQLGRGTQKYAPQRNGNQRMNRRVAADVGEVDVSNEDGTDGCHQQHGPRVA